MTLNQKLSPCFIVWHRENQIPFSLCSQPIHRIISSILNIAKCLIKWPVKQIHVRKTIFLSIKLALNYTHQGHKNINSEKNQSLNNPVVYVYRYSNHSLKNSAVKQLTKKSSVYATNPIAIMFLFSTLFQLFILIAK